jgi:predicted transcriptional regulator
MEASPRPIRRFAPRKTGDASPLGELESAVMRAVWSHHDDVSVADVHSTMSDRQQAAYTTLKTTMERLVEKGILKRMRQGKAYLYRAAVTQEELERRIVTDAIDRLVEQFPEAVASFFVQPDPSVSEAHLGLLSDAIKRKREHPDA